MDSTGKNLHPRRRWLCMYSDEPSSSNNDNSAKNNDQSDYSSNNNKPSGSNSPLKSPAERDNDIDRHIQEKGAKDNHYDPQKMVKRNSRDIIRHKEINSRDQNGIINHSRAAASLPQHSPPVDDETSLMVVVSGPRHSPPVIETSLTVAASRPYLSPVVNKTSLTAITNYHQRSYPLPVDETCLTVVTTNNRNLPHVKETSLTVAPNFRINGSNSSAIVVVKPRKKRSRPVNIAAEKACLKSQQHEARGRGDVGEVEWIEGCLRDLEEIQAEEEIISDRAIRLAEINKKNKMENLRNSSQYKPGEEGYDPSARRWTRPTITVSIKPERRPAGTVVGLLEWKEEGKDK